MPREKSGKQMFWAWNSEIVNSTQSRDAVSSPTLDSSDMHIKN